MEGYEGVEALGGVPPPQRRLYSRGAPLEPALVVLVGRWRWRWMVEGWRWRWRVEVGFIILHSVALQSLENIVDERLLGGDSGL